MKRNIVLILSLFWLCVACATEQPPATSSATTVVEPTVPPTEPVATVEVALSNWPEFTEWVEQDPATQGMDDVALDAVEAMIEEDLTHLYSLLVVRNGVLVHEYYQEGRDESSEAQVFSVTKSVVSLLVGIAQDDGLLTIDQTLGEFLNDEQLAESDPRLASVTIEQLLTMTSGYSCRGDSCFGDPVSVTLLRELDHDPGTTFNYDTGALHTLSVVLEQSTGMSIDTYAEQELFAPLGMELPRWEKDREGRAFTGLGLVMNSRELAQLGQLLLQEGEWNGERVISAEYLQSATQNQLAGKGNDDYGYLFWIDDVNGYPKFSAVGYGEQFITVIPDQDLVIVFTADYTPARRGSQAIIEPLIVDAIVD